MNDERSVDRPADVQPMAFTYADKLTLLPPDERDQAAETAYRRGYWHGYSQAMDDWKLVHRRGYTRVAEVFNFLAVFYDRVLTRWRYAPRPGLLDTPPSLKPPKTWASIKAEVIARDGKECVMCGSTAMLEIDHIVAVQDGGLAELDNLRVLCSPCNRRRNSDRVS